MLSVLLLTANPATERFIEGMLDGSDIFKLAVKVSPQIAHECMRLSAIHDPEIILVDLGNWDEVSGLVKQLKNSKRRAVIVGFKTRWNRLEMLTFEEAGILDLLHEPFTHHEFETAAYDALHRGQPIEQNVIALLPAKAGGGCSTVSLHVASALAGVTAKKVLLVESDRRSGIFSIMLNLKNRSGLSEALQQAGEITPVDWQQHTVWVSGIHLLPANPARRGPVPSWAEYFQLLRFARKTYDYVLVDLPEVVNEATAEVVKSARTIGIVCTPEVPSIKMAAQRIAELEACKVPADRIHVILNRWERNGLSIGDVEGIVNRPVLATLPNDYRQVRTAILESRLASSESRFAKGCKTVAQKLSGLPESPVFEPKFAFFRELVKIAN